MTDLFEGRELLDPILTSAGDPLHTLSVAAIAGVCNRPEITVARAGIVEELAADLWRLVVPRVKDLARELQLRSVRGATDGPTTSLLELLGGDRLSEDDLQRANSSIETAAALHLGDVLEHVAGPRQEGDYPRRTKHSSPSIETLKVGYHVHLFLEFVGLCPFPS